MKLLDDYSITLQDTVYGQQSQNSWFRLASLKTLLSTMKSTSFILYWWTNYQCFFFLIQLFFLIQWTPLRNEVLEIQAARRLLYWEQ